MPGHKGTGKLGFEQFDITEIPGADALYEADGIIAESEKNASLLFGSRATFYSTEGASQCIRAMLALACPEKSTVIATRNAHKAFIYAVALLDLNVIWLESESDSYSLCGCEISEKALDMCFQNAETKPSAVYLTSPDYLGGMLDISSLARVAHKYGAPLLVDNAHGAYLKFIRPSMHPLDKGADICCDSAHKTLPVLTGGAYLHIAKNAIDNYERRAKRTLAMFGSTSPSYLILESLDLANIYISDGYSEKLEVTVSKLSKLKEKLKSIGFTLYGSDMLKLTVCTNEWGYTGTEFAKILEAHGVVCEYADPDYVVMMVTPENTDLDYERILSSFMTVKKRDTIKKNVICRGNAEKKMSVRQAMLSESEYVSSELAVGRILAQPSVGCPPAVMPVCCGETVTDDVLKILLYYGIDKVYVVK
jgi:arginine/lysine/ornithine decarboxylase